MLRKIAGRLILYTNLFVAVLLLLSYTAPFINPSALLFPAFLGLAYPYLLLINLVFLVYWIIRFRKELLVSLVAILIGWGHLMNFLPLNFSGETEPAGNGDETSVRIMSYNVRLFDQYKWSKEENSTAGIFALIDENDPDILCLQEFYTRNRMGQREADVRRSLKKYPYYSVYYTVKSGPSSGVGIATFSKYPIVRTSRIPFDNTMNQAVYTDISMGEDTIRVFNIHLQSISFGQRNYNFLDTLSLKYSNRQLEEVKDIGMRLKDAFVRRADQSKIIHNYIADAPHPVVVAGDFNDTPTSYSYMKIKKGLEDAFREAGHGFGNTYAGELPSYRIDFILYSKDLEATDFSRIKSRYSDHFPVTAALRWKLPVADEE
ncbi:MAG: endonuclease/exonuclease/phosphatase family protein [Bacteroidales bacterium]|nr:endonuclease/exonuclease/phosphatase family protein [Bacteroidales bacterium]MDT8430241.1 endonuclease/exonuclease/phosphatase family protein [Bacteroidales bacterium]